MRRSTLATALATLSLAGAGTAVAQEGPFSANVSIVSDYAFRGISQTDQKPALQGGFDFEHESGFYAGVWGSNVSWLRDAERGTDVSSGNSLEVDIYAGYGFEVGGIGFDVGLLQYWYPGSYNRAWRAAPEDGGTGLKNPNTLEGYVGASWEFLSFKYSHSFTNLFGAPGSKNSKYYDLTAAYPIWDGLTVDAHVGYSDIRKAESYTDWKLGVTQTYAGFDFGLHYVDTDLKGTGLADERFIVSVSKSF